MTFDIVKNPNRNDPEGGLAVIEDGKYRVFTGNNYQCNLFIKARKEGGDLVTATHGAKARKERPYKTVKIYLD